MLIRLVRLIRLIRLIRLVMLIRLVRLVLVSRHVGRVQPDSFGKCVFWECRCTISKSTSPLE
jgi:hypothetical protein